MSNEKELNLPELEGSEKQISWANKIRAVYIDKVHVREKRILEILIKFFDAYKIKEPEREMSQSELDDIRKAIQEINSKLEICYNTFIINCVSAKFYIEKVNIIVENKYVDADCIFVGNRCFSADNFERRYERMEKQFINSDIAVKILDGIVNKEWFSIKLAEPYMDYMSHSDDMELALASISEKVEISKIADHTKALSGTMESGCYQEFKRQ